MGGNLSGAEFRRRQRGKNWAIGLVVAGLSVLFFVITILRMGGH
jgi:type II secretory pathway component PulL